MSEMYHVARKAAETMEGKCEHPKPGIFATRQTQCYWHESNWPDGRAVCERMADYIRLAEQAIEDAEPIIRADDRERIAEGPRHIQDRAWGPFHRHFANDVIHRDGGPECDQPGTPRRVYVFDPENLERHEAIIRADERESIAARGTAAALKTMRREVLADLRAKVEGLSGEARPSVEESGLGDDYWAGYDGAIADVLALFPEEKP